MMQLELIRTDSIHLDFIPLVKLLDADLQTRYGAEQAFFDQFNKLNAIRNVVVAYQDNYPVGCGAFKPHAEKTVEVKRMFVREEYRGKGVAGKILSELEKWAWESGFTSLVLETGHAQPEAIALYTKSGYIHIPNYGQYQDVESSVCFKKDLI